MEAFTRAADSLLRGPPEARAAADAWLQDWQRSPAAWQQAQALVAEESAPVEVRMLAAQALRKKVLLDLDQVGQDELPALHERLLQLLEEASRRDWPLVLPSQLSLALAALALQTDWRGTIEAVIRKWGAKQEYVLVLLQTLTALAEERGHPWLPPPSESDAEVKDFASTVGGWLSQVPLNSGTSKLQQGALRCWRCWLQWVCPHPDWVREAAGCLAGKHGVGDEAADALIEAAHIGDVKPASHGYLPELVCMAVAPLLGGNCTDSEVVSHALRVATEASEPLLPSITCALRAGHPDAQSLLGAFARSAGANLRSAARLFNNLAVALDRSGGGGRNDVKVGTNSIATAAFGTVLKTAVKELQDQHDVDALALCAAAAHGLGRHAAVRLLSCEPCSPGRTWALSAVMPRRPSPEQAGDDGTRSCDAWVFGELARMAESAPGPPEAGVFQQAGHWLRMRPALLPGVINLLVQGRHDVAVHEIVADAPAAAGPCVPLLVAAAPGRPWLSSAAVLAARELQVEDFKAVLNELAGPAVLAPSQDTKDVLQGMSHLMSGLRDLDRHPVLGAAATEALGHIAIAAWSVVLEPTSLPGSRDAALEVLRVALVVGQAALPQGNLVQLCRSLVAAFHTAAGPPVAEALALLLRQFGDEGCSEGTLGEAVAMVVSAGQAAGWAAGTKQLRSEGEDHLAAAWSLLERAARYMPRVARRLCTTEVLLASCAALSLVRPALALQGVGILGIWLEVGQEPEDDPASATQHVWQACLLAVRAVPPAAVLEALPSLFEALRDCREPPETLQEMLLGIFGRCASRGRLEAAAATFLRGTEAEIAVAMNSLVHCARRDVMREPSG